MLFNSAVFIFAFLPLVALVYFRLSAHYPSHIAKTWLVAASLFFYGYWNPVYLPLIIGSMCINYAIGLQLHRTIDSPLIRKYWLVTGIVFNLGLLAYFKYADFFISNIAALTDHPWSSMDIALPLAISFFTFQQIAYLADCHQADTPGYRFTDYCLFVTFFPQLIAGPIVHHKEMMPQFPGTLPARLDWDNIASGLFIFSIGLFKKVVVADQFATWANAGFSAGRILDIHEAWGASLSYTLQLYYDFSGYADMAIGAALLFNIRLPINFNSPYKAANIRDFWDRWHITLSRWLRDYLYIPLGGNRKGKARAHANLFMTFVLAGLWHGAAWTFIVWGITHGMLLSLHRFWRDAGFSMPRALAWPLFLIWLNATMVIFRAESLADSWHILNSLFGFNGFSSNINPVTTSETYRYIAVFGTIALACPNTMQMLRWIPYEGLLVFKPTVPTTIAASGIALVALFFLLTTTGSEFLYFNF